MLIYMLNSLGLKNILTGNWHPASKKLFKEDEQKQEEEEEGNKECRDQKRRNVSKTSIIVFIIYGLCLLFVLLAVCLGNLHSRIVRRRKKERAANKTQRSVGGPILSMATRISEIPEVPWEGESGASKSKKEANEKDSVHRGKKKEAHKKKDKKKKAKKHKEKS